MANTDVDLAFRARCEALVVATTGLLNLSATAAGYKSTTGSFVDDGFAVGMEVQPSGFPDNSVGTIVRVEPLTLSIYKGRTIAAVSSGRSIVAGLPALRIWDNRSGSTDPMVPYVEGEFMEQPGFLLSATKDGIREDRGMYVLRWYGLADFGALGLRRGVDALMARFTPHTTFSAGATDVVRLRSDFTAFASRVTQRSSGHALVTLTFPWRVYRRNAIAV